MKKLISIAMILIALTNILTICATSLTASDDLQYVIPAAPQNVTCVNTAQGVNISWDTVEDTAGYIIYRAAEGEEPVQIEDVRGYEENTYIDQGVKSGKTYTYFVKAYNAFNEGEVSEYYSLMYLAVPKSFTAKVAYGGVRLSWKKVNGAESYRVYKSVKGKYKELVIQDDSTFVYLDTTLKEYEVGSYMVEAVNGAYQSASVQAKSTPYLTSPVLLSAKNSNGYVTVTWKETASAEKYYIYRKTENTPWQKIKTVKKGVSSYKDTSIENNTVYTYTVKAKNNNNFSGCDPNGISADYISAPKNLTATNKNNTLTVKWGGVKGASKYFVYRKASSEKSWSKIGETTGKSFADKNIENGKQYTYRVKTISKTGARSGYSQTVKQLALKAPSGIKLVSLTDGVKISWKKMNTASYYVLYRKAPGETSWKRIYKSQNNTQTEFTDRTANSGKTYTYTVKQYKGNVSGSYNAKGVTIKYIAAPVVKLKHSPQGIVVSWSKCAAGTSYEVQRKVPGAGWKTIAALSTKTLSYTDQKPVYGKKNYYRINVTGCEKSVISNSKFLYGINPNKKLVALTFDDGPHSDVTNSILDTLSKNNSRATFFVVGSRVNTYAQCIKREASLGCEIANHTYNHTTLTSATSNTIKNEINKTNNDVKALTGVAPTLVRAPGGAVNDYVKNTVRYPLIQWSVDTLDWKSRNSASVVSHIKSNVRDGSIVLMHDLYGSTATATAEIVPWLIKNGYQIVTVSELMAVRGIEMRSGQVYYSAS